MKPLKSIGAMLIVVACVASSDCARGNTIQTFGAGTAVTTIDRSTTFDDLDFAHNGTPLSDYLSNGLLVRTNGNSYYGDNALGQVGLGGEPVSSNSPYLNPFLITGPSGPSYSFVGGGYYFPYDGSFGNTDWVSVQTIDQKKIFGAEFLYGNGWSNGDVYGTFPWGNNSATLEWQTYSGGALISSGSATPNVGTVIGFSDADGFDTLRVRATGIGTGDLQEIAIDNLNVQFTVPEPSTLALLGIGIVGLLGRRSRNRLASGITWIRLRLIAALATVAFVAVLHSGAAQAETQTFFNNSQVALPWASGATSDTIRCDGYQFNYTVDKYWSPTGSGQPTGRLTPITWPTGIDAQTITSGPGGVLPAQVAAQVVITRVDGSVFDLLSFTGKILGNTAGAGAAFEIMPVLNGNDGFADPLAFDATGYANQSFTYAPNLIGYDTYHISLWMDYGLTGLIVNGAAIPPPGVSLWNSAVSGNWSDPTRWTGGVPDAVGAGAVFSPSTSAALTITLDSPRTVGTLHFGNSGSSTTGYVLTGSRSDTLTLNNSGSGATITAVDGSHIFDAPLVLVDSLVVSGSGKLTFGSSSSIVETGGRHSLTMSGTGGTLVLSGSNTYTGGTTVTAGTLTVASNLALANGTGLTVGAGAAFGAAAAATAADRPVGVPEPSMLVLLAAGAIGLLGYKWRRRE